MSGPVTGVVLGDNLPVLGALPRGSVDLIYIDPPFATGTRRRGSSGHVWDDRLDLTRFLEFLRPRLEAMHQVLAPHGSLFVHLDWRASHYVKVELDRIFGFDRLVNEIIWCYSIGGKSARAFGRKHDTIFWYSRTADYHFCPDAVRIARRPNSHMKLESDAQGRPVQVKRDRRTGRIYRYPVHAGKVPEDYWTDVETLNRGDRERTGWPTQKPEALLERIILAASAPGALVADFFCGSGTTAAVARRLGRRFLAVDVSPEAVRVARLRLEQSAPPHASFFATGLAARALADANADEGVGDQ